MKISATVVQDRCETWFKGKKDEVEKRIFTLLDLDTDTQTPMTATLDYRPTPEECKAFPVRSLLLKPVVISVSDLRAGGQGRIVIQGRIVEPKVNGNGAPGESVASQKRS